MLPESLPKEYISQRKALHELVKLSGELAKELNTPQPEWLHIGLIINQTGFETPPLTKAKNIKFVYDLSNFIFKMTHEDGTEIDTVNFDNISPEEFFAWIKSKLSELSIEVNLNTQFSSQAVAINEESAKFIHTLLIDVNNIFEVSKNEIGAGSSETRLWPHHFDLSFNWYSGKTLDNEKEMIYHGFSLGDEQFPNPYFALYRYPWPQDYNPEVMAPANLNINNWKGICLDFQYAYKDGEINSNYIVDFIEIWHNNLAEFK